MLLNYKYEIFLTIEQQEMLNLWLAWCRQTYNSALLDKSTLQEVFCRLEKAFEKFFKKEAKYPKIKSSKDYYSLTFTQFAWLNNTIKNITRRAPLDALRL